MASWIITEDVINDGEYKGEWNGDKIYVDAGKCKNEFRLLDDDGEIYFYGKSGNSSSFSPIDDFGIAFGCTDIQYKENGVWESL